MKKTFHAKNKDIRRTVREYKMDPKNDGCIECNEKYGKPILRENLLVKDIRQLVEAGIRLFLSTKIPKEQILFRIFFMNFHR